MALGQRPGACRLLLNEPARPATSLRSAAVAAIGLRPLISALVQWGEGWLCSVLLAPAGASRSGNFANRRAYFSVRPSDVVRPMPAMWHNRATQYDKHTAPHNLCITQARFVPALSPVPTITSSLRLGNSANRHTNFSVRPSDITRSCPPCSPIRQPNMTSLRPRLISAHRQHGSHPVCLPSPQ